MNLLPPQQKDEVYRDILMRFFPPAFALVAFFAAVFLVFTYNVILYLKVQLPPLTERFEQETKTETSKELLAVEEEFNELNRALLQIQKIRQTRSPDVPEVLRRVANLIPDGAEFKSISFQGEVLNITGHAKTRAQALALKENFEKDSICANIRSPIFVKEKDVDFTFTCALPIL
jgi:hypothetical protein